MRRHRLDQARPITWRPRRLDEIGQSMRKNSSCAEAVVGVVGMKKNSGSALFGVRRMLKHPGHSWKARFNKEMLNMAISNLVHTCCRLAGRNRRELAFSPGYNARLAESKRIKQQSGCLQQPKWIRCRIWKKYHLSSIFLHVNITRCHA